MADNDPNKTPSLSPKTSRGLIQTKPNLPKHSEHLAVNYSIEKLSGLRTGKRSNTFKVNTSTSTKTIIHTILKKVKFSTRFKYAILYFDQERNSKNYLEWRKFKEKPGQVYLNPVKFRVCRFKVTENKPENKETLVSPMEVQTGEGFSYNNNLNFQQRNPDFSYNFFRYVMYVQCARMMALSNMTQ